MNIIAGLKKIIQAVWHELLANPDQRIKSPLAKQIMTLIEQADKPLTMYEIVKKINTENPHLIPTLYALREAKLLVMVLNEHNRYAFTIPKGDKHANGSEAVSSGLESD